MKAMLAKLDVLDAIVRDAVAEERERCAKIVDDYHYSLTVYELAAKIREVPK